jgi:hypothetical protein
LILRDGRVLQRIDAALRAGKRVLVHCQAGAQRSPAVVAAYLVALRGMGLEEAVALLFCSAFFWAVNFRRTLELVERDALRGATSPLCRIGGTALGMGATPPELTRPTVPPPHGGELP